jgi:hypothetical protein
VEFCKIEALRPEFLKKDFFSSLQLGKAFELSCEDESIKLSY